MTMEISRIVAVAATVCAAQAFAGDYRAPRLPDGTPDLQGVWTNATATPFERSPELGDRRAFTEQEAAAISKAALAAVAADAAPSDPDKKIEAIESLPPVGNYNLFWTDRGMPLDEPSIPAAADRDGAPVRRAGPVRESRYTGALLRRRQGERDVCADAASCRVPTRRPRSAARPELRHCRQPSSPCRHSARMSWRRCS